MKIGKFDESSDLRHQNVVEGSLILMADRVDKQNKKTRKAVENFLEKMQELFIRHFKKV